MVRLAGGRSATRDELGGEVAPNYSTTRGPACLANSSAERDFSHRACGDRTEYGLELEVSRQRSEHDPTRR